MKRFVICLALALAACGAEPANGPQDAAEPPPRMPSPLPMREIAGNFTVITVSRADDGKRFADQARYICGDKSFCKVGIWTDPDLMPRGFPMTDREVAGQAFMYSLNRDTGFEQTLWRCDWYPQSDPDHCLSTE
jgi:hypothetical protein